MKPRMFALLAALLFPAFSLAALTDLSVELAPHKSVYAQGDSVAINVGVTGPGPEFRFTLRRLSPEPAAVVTSAWRQSPDFNLATGSLLTSAGKYQLVVKAREAANPATLVEQRINFEIASAEAITAALQVRHAQAVQTVREALRRVIRRQGFGLEVDVVCAEEMSDSDQLIQRLLAPNSAAAPGGGPAFVAGNANVNTGAIGVEMMQGCESPDDWFGMEVALHMPAYLGMPAQTTVIGYDTVLLPEAVQAQRDLVVARYNDAIAKITAALRQVIRRQGNGIDYTNELLDFNSADSLIMNRINPFEKVAPRGGNAFRALTGGDAHTGAIGIVLTAPPTDFNDWSGVSVNVYLPAFLGLEPQSRTIAYDAVLTNEEMQLQRDLVVRRYNLAINQAQEVFANAREQLISTSRAKFPYQVLQSSENFISARLNGSARAPRGGPAWQDSFSGNAQSGAVGIELVQPPASAQVWAGTQMKVHLPAFLGLEAQSTVISFDE